jgi:rhodanese-related sulfurtransferase
MDASINSSELQSDLAGGGSPLVIDARKSPAFRAASDIIAGALRRDPACVPVWAKELPQASTVVTYCVRGHEVSQGVAQTLREAGISARYLLGGIEDGCNTATRCPITNSAMLPLLRTGFLYGDSYYDDD